jgi:thioredoxin 1
MDLSLFLASNPTSTISPEIILKTHREGSLTDKWCEPKHLCARRAAQEKRRRHKPMNRSYSLCIAATIMITSSLVASASPDSMIKSRTTTNSNGIVQYYPSAQMPSASGLQPQVIKPSVITPTMVNYPQLETQAQTTTMAMPVIVSGNDSTFQSQVLQSQDPVLVEFYATWCPHCQKMDSVLQNFSQQYRGNAKVVRIDIDKNPQVVARYKVGPVPAFFVFNHGNIVDSVVGETDVARLVAGMSKATM